MKSWELLSISNLITAVLFFSEHVFGRNTRDVCNRDPPDTSAVRLAGDNGYRVKIPGLHAENGYTPGQVYTVTINGTLPKQKLLGFMLVAVPENAKDESTTMGTLQHLNDGLTKFAEECPYVIMHTYHHSKSGVSMLWTAPPRGSGCVEFRATVIAHKDIWYKDSGALTQRFCEDTGLSEESVSPELIPDCCACGVAKYQMTFEGIWSRQSHPRDFPKNAHLLHWSNIVGASHTKYYIPWQYGHYATYGVREVCEYGDPRGVEKEMRNHSKHIRTVIKTPGIWVNLKQTRWARFSVNSSHHLMTMLSMLGPSPDWCVGVSALELCLPNCTWAGDQTIDLLPWDAGTDNGLSYMSPNSRTDPQEKIRHITNLYPKSEQSPFYGRNPIRPLAKLRLKRIHPKPGMPPKCNGNEQDNDDLNSFAIPERHVAKPGLSMAMKKKLLMMNGKCATTEWLDWSGCSVTCGVGVRTRKRMFLSPEVDEAMCGKRTTEKDNCIGFENECEKPDEDCAVTGWSEWNPCSVTCGKGFKERRRYYLNKMDMKRCNRKMQEMTMCVNTFMDCTNLPVKNFSAICNLPLEEGPCRGNFIRWYYDNVKTKCMAFPYGGCRGNDNRFRTQEECHKFCMQPRSSTKDPPEKNTVPPVVKETTTPSAQRVNCMVTQWSEWTACPVTCGRGYQHRRRMIKRHPENGGKKCPKKLQKKKKCKRQKCPRLKHKSKKHVVNCKLGPWTVWTPCGKSCGDSIRERSRPVLQQPKHGGKACQPYLERRYCSLPACPITITNKKRSTAAHQAWNFY